jgi:hypothetical protein
MDSNRKDIEKAAKKAIEKHQRLLHAKVLELVLSEMVAMDGVSSTRKKLKWYYDHLKEFDNGIGG